MELELPGKVELERDGKGENEWSLALLLLS